MLRWWWEVCLDQELPVIPIEKVRALPGTLEARIFWNPHLSLPPTLCYALSFPMESFDSGLDYMEQPEQTSIEIEWLELGQRDWRLLADTVFHPPKNEDHGSIYVGSAHNPLEIESLCFGNRSGSRFEIAADLHILFDCEGVGKPARYALRSECHFRGLLIYKHTSENLPDGQTADSLFSSLAEVSAYRPNWSRIDGVDFRKPVD